MDDLVAYDTENTDLNPKHGQITQFGGVKVDGHFGTIDQLNIDVRLLPWVIPMPIACRIQGVNPRDLYDPKRISEFEASKIISKFLVPDFGKDRIFVTYNGSKHDDECLRYMFYRNLLNPWFNSSKNVTKIDLFPLVQLIHSVDPRALVVPQDEDGKLSYKLDRLAPANGISIKAHDALGDSLATLELAKLIIRNAPWAWELAKRNGRFLTVESSIASSVRDVKPLWLFTHFGEPTFTPVVPLCDNGQNTHLMLDLSRTDVPHDCSYEDGKLVFKGSPFNLVKTKGIPLLVSEDIVRLAGISFDGGALKERIQEIRNDKVFLENARRAHAITHYQKPEVETSEERMIGSGFIDKITEGTMKQFRNARTWEERLPLRFPGDARARDFAARIYLDADDHKEVVLKDSFRSSLEEICQSTINRPYGDIDARWSTLSHALEEKPDLDWLTFAINQYGEDPRLLAALKELGVALPLPVDQPEPEVTPAGNQMSFGF